MSKLLGIALMLGSIIIGTPAALFFKKSVTLFSFKNIQSFFLIFKSKNTFIGGGLFFLSFVIYLFALKQASLSYLYPLVSVSYVLIAILGRLFLNEEISKKKIIGIALIMLGVLLVTLS